MINPKSLPNNKPDSASMKIQSKQQLEQMYITAKVDLEQKNYSNQYKLAMERKMFKNELNPVNRFYKKGSLLPTHFSSQQYFDNYTRKKTGFFPLTEKQRWM